MANRSSVLAATGHSSPRKRNGSIPRTSSSGAAWWACASDYVPSFEQAARPPGGPKPPRPSDQAGPGVSADSLRSCPFAAYASALDVPRGGHRQVADRRSLPGCLLGYPHQFPKGADFPGRFELAGVHRPGHFSDVDVPVGVHGDAMGGQELCGFGTRQLVPQPRQ